MKRFLRYIQEDQNNAHPHYGGASKADKAGTVTHTYTDSKLGVRTRLFTHPKMSGSAYWGFEVKNKDGEWTQKAPKAGENAPKGRLRSALDHVAHFARTQGISNITYQTNTGSDNHAMFQAKWPEYQPEVAKKVSLTQVEKNPLKQHYIQEQTDFNQSK